MVKFSLTNFPYFGVYSLNDQTFFKVLIQLLNNMVSFISGKIQFLFFFRGIFGAINILRVLPYPYFIFSVPAPLGNTPSERLEGVLIVTRRYEYLCLFNIGDPSICLL